MLMVKCLRIGSVFLETILESRCLKLAFLFEVYVQILLPCAFHFGIYRYILQYFVVVFF